MHRIGLVGYGGMGHWHTEKIATLDEAEIIGIYDINPDKMREARKNGFATYPSLEAMVTDDCVDTVLLAVPNNFHKPYVIRALQADKNVICEKPVAMCAADMEEMIAAAEKSKGLFSVHQNRRWDKDYNIVKKVIDSGAIGEPFYIESRVQGSKGVPGDWRCVKEAGGGMMLDWGVHMIDQLLWYVKSPVTQVYAHMLSVKFKDVDDNFKLLLRFENGLSALVEVDTYTFINLPRWHVSGTEGTMVVEDWDCNGRIVRAKTVSFNWEEGIVYTSAGPTKTMAPRPKESLEQMPLPEIKVDCRDYYRNFIAAAEGKEELIVKPEEALRVMRVMDAAFESSRKGICVQCRI